MRWQVFFGERVNENEMAVLDFTLYFSVPHEDRQT